MSNVKNTLMQNINQLTDSQKASLVQFIVDSVMDEQEVEVINWMIENVIDGLHPFEDMDDQSPISLKELLENPNDTKKSGVQATVIPIETAIKQGVLSSTITHANIRTGDVIQEIVMVILHDGHTLSVEDIQRGEAVQCSCMKWVKHSTTKTCCETGETICPKCWRKIEGCYYSKRAGFRKNFTEFWGVDS